jgi:hypothetical protein
MGLVSPNAGSVWFHVDHAGNVVDVRTGGWHFQPATGSTWITPPPMALPDYAELHAAAKVSMPAFEAELVGGPWSDFYWQALPTGADREIFRGFVAFQPPVARIAPLN